MQVRIGLDGITDQFWTDDEIISWLNEGAQLMCSLAQLLVGAVQIDSTQNVQEYVLPEDCDEVDAVSYNNGTLLRMGLTQQNRAQVSNRVTGTPTRFYMRIGTFQFMNHGGPGASSSSEIALSNIPQGPGRKPRKVLGLYPIPSASGQTITVIYYQKHYQMLQDNDEPAVPEEFQRGWLDFAIAKGKTKESAYAESDKFMASFKDYAQRLTEKWQNQGQESAFPRMNVRGLNADGDQFGGSSWINLYVGDV